MYLEQFPEQFPEQFASEVPTVSFFLTQEKNETKLPIRPNRNKKQKNCCFPRLHLFLHCVFFFCFFIYQIYVFWCWRFSVLLDLYCLVKCSYNHSLMWATPPPPPLSLHIVSPSTFFLSVCFPALMKASCGSRRLRAEQQQPHPSLLAPPP